MDPKHSSRIHFRGALAGGRESGPPAAIQHSLAVSNYGVRRYVLAISPGFAGLVAGRRMATLAGRPQLPRPGAQLTSPSP